MSNATPWGTAGPLTGRNYLLFTLTLFYVSSFVDRAIINVLAEDIRRDLMLTDTELGVLGGIAFAALYSLLGLPVARLAERSSRKAIITWALTIWSAMTMLCALAATFWQLAMFRAGVGIGEAACTPCAHSMIGDSFPPEKRATALSVYSTAAPLGSLIGTLGGAFVAHAYSWRAAFLAVGAPGLLLALLASTTLEEPRRMSHDGRATGTAPSLRVVLRHLWSRRAFRHLLLGFSASTTISAGLGAFGAPYMLRSDFGIDLRQAALIGALTMAGSFVGRLFGGPISERLAKRHVRWLLWTPAVASLITAPVLALAFAAGSLPLFMALSLIGLTTALVYIGRGFAALHNMVAADMRATSSAIVLMVAALVGMGLGPVIVGGISDALAGTLYGADSSECVRPAKAACAEATFDGLRGAMIAISLLYVWPAFHFFMAGSHLQDALLVDDRGGQTIGLAR